jgi:threonine/homoserine/homoserine lactone efflux protein
MNIENYLLFVGASIILVLVPGPDMVYLLGRSISGGRKAGLAAVLGINLGGYVHLTAAVLGLSAIIATSAFAFSVVKWAGALYLVYIGITTLIGKSKPLQIEVDGNGGHRSGKQALQSIFWQGFISDVLNPKVAIFFLALLPQFVVESAQNKIEQLLILGVTSNMIAIAINTLIVYLSSRITTRLRANNRLASWLNNTMGGIFILLGVRLAGEKL